MNAPFQVAQLGSPGGKPTKIVKLQKPASGQAQTVQLSYDGSIGVDLSAIANEKITLVHVGERLIILFDNQATLTLDPFFDSTGAPLPGLSIQIGDGRLLTGQEFATLFPITDDQSVLPAAGPGGQGQGANFRSAVVDDIAGPSLNELMPQEELPGLEFSKINAPLTESEPLRASGLTLNGLLEEEHLNERSSGSYPQLSTGNEDPDDLTGLDDDTDAPPDFDNITNEITGNLSPLVTGGSGTLTWTLIDVVGGPDAAVRGGTGDPVFSQGEQVFFTQYDTGVSGEVTLVATTGGNEGRVVFTITVGQNGEFVFTLYDQIDHPFKAPGATNEEFLGIDLSQVIQVSDLFTTLTFGGQVFTISVIDDTPILTSATEHRTVDEDDILTPWSEGTSPNDGTADGSETEGAFGPAFISGSLGALVSIGSDEHPYGEEPTPIFSFTTDVLDKMAGLGLFSKQSVGPAAENGLPLYYTIGSSGNWLILSAFEPDEVAGAPDTGNPVFELRINQFTGAYEFRLFDELIHKLPPEGTSEENFTLRSAGGFIDAIDFGAIIQVADYDRDPVTLAGKFTIQVRDDVPDADVGASHLGFVQHDETAGVAPFLDQLFDGDRDLSFSTLPADIRDLFTALETQTNVGDDPHVDEDTNGAVSGNGAIGYARSFLIPVADDDSETGADAPPAVRTLALEINGGAGTFSGIETTGGTGVFLYEGSGDYAGLILGRVGFENGGSDTADPNGTVAFAIALGQDGHVSVAQYLSLKHPDFPDNRDEAVDLKDGDTDLIVARVTITDSDGDTDTDTVGIGSRISFDDDGPHLTATLNDLEIIHDETPGDDGDHDTSTDLSALFAGVTNPGDDPDVPPGSGPIGFAQSSATLLFLASVTDADYGSDGPSGGASIAYSIDVPGSSEPSGLSTTAGRPITLFEVSPTLVVGRYDPAGGTITSSDPAAFAIRIDPNTGVISIVQYVSLRHDDRGDSDEQNDNGTSANDAPPPDNPPGPSTAPIQQAINNGALRLTVTITDGDGDQDSQTFNIGNRIVFEDDGPSVTGQTPALLVDEDDLPTGNSDVTAGDDLGDPSPVVLNGTIPYTAGADGLKSLDFAAMHSTNVTTTGAAPVTVNDVQLKYFWHAASGTLYASTNIANAGTASATAAFKVVITNAAAGAFAFSLLGPVDHPLIDDSPGLPDKIAFEDNLEIALTFSVIDGDDDFASGTLTVNIDDDLPVIAPHIDDGSMCAVGAVDEDGLNNAWSVGIGDVQPGDLPGNNTVATGNLGIAWGADNADAADAGSQDGALTTLSGRNVTFTDSTVEVEGVSTLKSHGDTITVVIDENGTRLRGVAGEGDDFRTVFEVKLFDDGTGSYRFELFDQLDQAPGDNENDITLAFGFTAKDSDADGATGHFKVLIDDDLPVVTGRLCPELSEDGGEPGKTANFALVLDSSGSIDSAQLNLIKANAIKFLQDLTASGAENVRVHIVDFDSNSAVAGTFDLILNGDTKDGVGEALDRAIAAVNALVSGGNTNYEAGLSQALEWIEGGTLTVDHSHSFDADTDSGSDTAHVLVDSNDIRIAIVSAWEPFAANTLDDASGGTGTGFGVNSGDNLDETDEMLRFDFGAFNDFDGSDEYGRAEEAAGFRGSDVLSATFVFRNFMGGDPQIVDHTIHFVGGGSESGSTNFSGATSGNVVLAGTGPNTGKLIAYIEFTVPSGEGGRIDLQSVTLPAGPLPDADVSKVIFFSDGEPNRALDSDGDVITVGVSDALTQSTNEISDIETDDDGAGPQQAFQIEAFGANATAGGLAVLDQVEGSGGSAVNITTSPGGLSGALSALIASLGPSGGGGGGSSSVGVELASLLSAGADEEITFKLKDDTSGLPDLSSDGTDLVYDVNDAGTILTAKAGLAGPTIFTLGLESDGTATFTLLGALDHGALDTLHIDFSSLISATDFDGDPAAFPANAFCVEIEDAVMPLTFGGVTKVLEEEHLGPNLTSGSYPFLSDGNEDATSSPDADDDPDTPDGDDDAGQDVNVTRHQVTADLATLVSGGAGIFSFALLTGSALPALESKGAPIAYDINVGTGVLTGFVDNGASGLSVDDRVVFALSVQTNGQMSFTLYDQIDHHQTADHVEGILDLDFSGLVRVTDTITSQTLDLQNLIVRVIDDIPVFHPTADKDFSYREALSGSSGTFDADIGADEPGTVKITSITDLPGLTETISGDGLSVTATFTASGDPAYTLSINPGAGTYDFQLLSPLVGATFTNVAITIPPGTPVQSVTTLSLPSGGTITFDGVRFDPFSNPNDSTDEINPNANGFGINNGNVDTDEGFVAIFNGTTATTLTFQINFSGSITGTNVTWQAYKSGVLVASVTDQLVSNPPDPSTYTIDPSGAVDFDEVRVQFENTPSNQNLRVENFTATTVALPAELSLDVTLTAADEDGDAASDTFNITVTNTPPTAGTDLVYVSDSTNDVTIPIASLLGNDSDPDAGTLSITAVGALTGISGSIPVFLDTVNGVVRFDTPGINGDDTTGNSFTYTLSDGHGGTATGTVNVHVIDTAGDRTYSIPGAPYAAAYLDGHTGDDVLTGGSADDVLIGDNDEDTLDGGGGNDRLIGGNSGDTLKGGAGDDFMDGGAGTDLLDFSDGTAGINFTLAQSSSDTVVNLVAAGLGSDTYRNMNGVIGTGFADMLTGTDSSETMVGGGGADTIDVGGGNNNDNDTDVVRFASTDDYGDTINNFDTSGGGSDLLHFTDALNTLFDDVTNNNNIQFTSDNNSDNDNAAVNLNTTSEGLFLDGNSGEGVTNADLANAAAVAAEFSAEFAITAAAGESALLVINDTTGNSASIWQYTESTGAAGGAGEISAGEVTLIALVNSNAAIATGNLDFA